MVASPNHDSGRYTQMQKTIYDIKRWLPDDAGKVDRRRSSYQLREEPEGRKKNQPTRFGELEAENRQLREAISNLKRDKLFLQEAVCASPSLYRDH
jgi:hypothetical protein